MKHGCLLLGCLREETPRRGGDSPARKNGRTSSFSVLGPRPRDISSQRGPVASEKQMTWASGEQRQELISSSESEAGLFFCCRSLRLQFCPIIQDRSFPLVRLVVYTFGGAADAR